MCLGVILRFYYSLQTKPEVSSNSAQRYSITAAKKTGASAETLVDHLFYLIKRPILPTGKINPALSDYVVLNLTLLFLVPDVLTILYIFVEK